MAVDRIHAKVDGPIVMVGFGSIGRGLLPLLERHIDFDKSLLSVIDPDASHRNLLDERNIQFLNFGLTEENYKDVLTPLLLANGKQGLCIVLAVEVSSLDIMNFCKQLNVLYIDTVVEPWPGFYFNPELSPAVRSNYALRENVLKLRKKSPAGSTAISCCGANPGMVSWLVKEALLNICNDFGLDRVEPQRRSDWAKLMKDLGVKGVHIAERDTQKRQAHKPRDTFVNTWSIEGFLSEGLQPAELGWGTHEKWMPPTAGVHKTGSGAAIYLMEPGANTRVRSWTPTGGGQFGLMVTHNESISISDYFTEYDESGRAIYRPTCHYAYHPCDDAVLSLYELFGQAAIRQSKSHIIEEYEIIDGVDELGVLLYGHARNAYWYGSRLSIDETKALAPYQNATGLQVTSAVLAGIVWLIENPQKGIVEADEMDFRRCLEIQRPYLGEVFGIYTDWTPLTGRPGLFPEDLDLTDPWQFRNVLVQ